MPEDLPLDPSQTNTALRKDDSAVPQPTASDVSPTVDSRSNSRSGRSILFQWTAILTTAATLFGGAVALAYYGEFFLKREPACRDDVSLVQQRPSSRDFDLSTLTIPAAEVRGGGPPKDGIPALSNPQVVPASAASFLNGNDRVIGVARGDQARAYPLSILNFHEIVNDRVGDDLIAVTYCPLCDSAVVFDRRTPLGVREFGVSGLLYNSNVLMYDRSSDVESLWSQMKFTGVSGPGANISLRTLPLELTTWADWQARHPETSVLSVVTGHSRDYRRNPYEGYFDRPQLMFPAAPQDDRLPTKERVLGMWTADAAIAFPAAAFGDQPTQIRHSLGSRDVVIEYHPAGQRLRVVEAPEDVEWVYSLWFAWYAFHPETEIYQPAP